MTDNGSPADVNASEPAEEFPTKLRVHALARILGLTSRQVLAHLAELGWQSRSAQSSVERDVARAVAERVRNHVPADESAVAEQNAPQSGAPTSDAPAPDTPRESSAGDQPASLFSAAEAASHDPVPAVGDAATGPLFLPPAEQAAAPSRADTRTASVTADTEQTDGDQTDGDTDTDGEDASSGDGRSRRRRRGRRGRGRGRGDQGDHADRDDADGDRQDADPDNRGTGNESGGSNRGDGKQSGADESGGDKKAADDTDGKDTEGKTNDAKDKTGKDGKGKSGDKSGKDKSAKPSGKKGKKSKAGGKQGGGDADASDGDGGADQPDPTGAQSDEGAADGDTGSSKRRRRRRRRKGGGDGDDGSPDDPPNTVVHEREPRSKRSRDEVQGISGSTRLEAKRQRRRDGRDAGRRRPPILSESEFLARREAVDRVMVVRERSANSALTHPGSAGEHEIEDYTQVAVLEDGVLVEHFVTTETSSSMVGNIYLGRVQNVLPGMEAAFVDIGRGRNGVLYAGEVNWDAAGLDGGSRKIEQALKPGDNVVVQVSKDPVGHKGARLTTQISLAGRYLVYVPGGTSTGISRKLPDTERKRLKQILAKLVPDNAGVIIRTASEGVSAEDLAADIDRLATKWSGIESQATDAEKGSGSASPRPLYEEPDLLVRVVRDLFNEDFKKLVVEGDKAWNLVEGYVSSVAPDLMDRVEKFAKPRADGPDSFVVHRIDEQLAKALDRKVWLPSGGTLIIEHTEAMTVIDVNTGKFTGSGGNLEETVTRNNLEAAEEIVRQMRLRDIGGMIIVDFIDMVLESNRDLVLRRLTEALSRDRTRHQVSEVTSLGLVQMTRKRLGTGLLEAFSTTCTTCGGRGIIVHANPVEVKTDDTTRGDGGGSKRSRRGKRKSEQQPAAEQKPAHHPAEHPMFRAMAAHAHDGDGVEDVEIVSTAGAGDGDAADAADHAPGMAPDGTASNGAESNGTASDGAQSDGKTGKAKADKAERGRTDQVSEHAATDGTVTDEAATAMSDADTDGAPTPAADAAASDGPPRRRRRAVRRAASPSVTSEPITIPEAPRAEVPATTSGPASPNSAPETGGSEAGAEAAVAVRRRPRRRAAGRPAGPPVDE